MQGITGKTGLTQKEAIFQTIRSVVGDRFREGVDVRAIVCEPNHYGRREHTSAALDEITRRIAVGLRDGTIPSEKYSASKQSGTSGDYRVTQYSRRIALYWLRHDKRLTGGPTRHSEATCFSARKYWNIRLEDTVLRRLILQLPGRSEYDHAAISQIIYIRKLELLLQAHGINVHRLPDEVKADLEFNTCDGFEIENREKQKIVDALREENYTEKEIAYIVYGKGMTDDDLVEIGREEQRQHDSAQKVIRRPQLDPKVTKKPKGNAA